MGSLGHKEMAMNTSVMTFGVVPRAPVSETLDSEIAARRLGGDGAGWTRDAMPVQPSKPTTASALTKPADNRLCKNRLCAEGLEAGTAVHRALDDLDAVDLPPVSRTGSSWKASV